MDWKVMSFNSYSEFHGGAVLNNIAGDASIDHRLGRVQSISASAPGIDVTLPLATRFPIVGGPVFEIVNTGANDFNVVNDGGTLIGVVAVGETGEVVLLDNSDADGEWRMESVAHAFPNSSTTGGPASSVGGSGDLTPGTLGSGTGMDTLSTGGGVSGFTGFTSTV